MELVQKILETTEESILKRLKSVFEQSDEDWWDLIDDEEKKAVDEGLAQLNSGNTIPHEEVMKKTREKFNIQ